jgi:hypothetical protein
MWISFVCTLIGRSSKDRSCLCVLELHTHVCIFLYLDHKITVRHGITYCNPMNHYFLHSIRSWSSEGCNTTKVNNHVTQCECNHLTNFAILMRPYTEVNILNKNSEANCPKVFFNHFKIERLCLIFAIICRVCFVYFCDLGERRWRLNSDLIDWLLHYRGSFNSYILHIHHFMEVFMFVRILFHCFMGSKLCKLNTELFPSYLTISLLF